MGTNFSYRKTNGAIVLNNVIMIISFSKPWHILIKILPGTFQPKFWGTSNMTTFCYNSAFLNQHDSFAKKIINYFPEQCNFNI